MTRDEIIRMARDVCETADPIIDDESDLAVFMLDELERFAALVAVAAKAEEREACAKVCDARYIGDNNREDMEAKRCAAAIRARGEK